MIIVVLNTSLIIVALSGPVLQVLLSLQTSTSSSAMTTTSTNVVFVFVSYTIPLQTLTSSSTKNVHYVYHSNVGAD